jgi:hypothetical protein
MEHRRTKRLAINLKAAVRIGNSPPVYTTTRNISSHGLCLITSHTLFKPFNVLHIELGELNGPLRWCSRALIVHTSLWGTGVLLEKKIPASFYISEVHN